MLIFQAYKNAILGVSACQCVDAPRTTRECRRLHTLIKKCHIVRYLFLIYKDHY